MSSDRSLARSALLVAAGAILSGPVGMALAALRPQPPWRDVETYAAHFHPLQQAPFWFGFVLLGGCILFMARAIAVAGEAHRTRAIAALICSSAFAAMIFINYTLQVAVVPWAARARDPSLAYFVMANPGAICWAFEMFGYGIFGAATWLIAPAFEGRWVRRLLVANGVVSITGAVVTAGNLVWVHSAAGLISFAGWNVLLIGAMLLVAFRYRVSPRTG
jgi:hypothetical protein